jgi:hypothetical protein
MEEFRRSKIIGSYGSGSTSMLNTILDHSFNEQKLTIINKIGRAGDFSSRWDVFDAFL